MFSMHKKSWSGLLDTIQPAQHTIGLIRGTRYIRQQPCHFEQNVGEVFCDDIYKQLKFGEFERSQPECPRPNFLVLKWDGTLRY